MECPYCKKEMEEGYLSAYRSEPAWSPGPLNRPEELWPEDGLRLVDPGLLATKRVPSWLCRDCKVLITPVKEYQTTWDKMKDKWKDFTEKTAREREEQTRERREAQQEKDRETRRKKDPWEV